MKFWQKSIEQSRVPTGRLGRIMLLVMGKVYQSMTAWGLSKIDTCEKVLDVGCGAGGAIYQMAKSNKFKSIYGIDISQESINLAQTKNQDFVKKDIVKIIEASVLDMPFENNYFDAVTTFQSHYHWSDVLAAMKEIHRVLKPNGCFVLVAEIYKIEYHMKKYDSVTKTRDLLIDSGFCKINTLKNANSICVIGYK